MIIGKFTSDKDGSLTGMIDTLFDLRRISFRPNPKGADYSVLTEAGTEVGAAWKRTSRDGKAFVSVKLDSPFMAAPLNCALFQEKDKLHNLVWQRRPGESEAESPDGADKAA